MPISTATKALLCLCPPAVMAGTVATVPAAKRAVHHWTAPRHAPTRHVAAHAAPQAPAPQRVDCEPGAPGALPAVPLVTYAAPIPDEPGGAAPAGSGTPSGAAGGPAAIALLGGGDGGGGGGGGGNVTPPVTAPVPEPATWLLLIGGAGAVGMALRRRRGRGATGAGVVGGTALWSGGAAVEASEMAATAAVRSTVAAKTTAGGLAAKAALCVCPAAVVAGSVMTVPPLRHAVHASTAMPAVPIANAAALPPRPCDPAVIPVSAAPLAGFPASVNTVPATAAPAGQPATATS